MAGIATGQILSFSIGVDESQTLNLFTHIEVFRSRSGSSGPYTEITGANWDVAQLRVPAKATIINGSVASFRVNEKNDVSVTFSGTDPISAASIATQIQAQSLGLLSAAIVGSELVVSTKQPGAAATLRAVESDGIGLLGFSSTEPDALGFGTDARIPLVVGKTSYDFTDPHGSADYYYKVRYSNTGLNSVSDYSAPFQPSIAQGLDNSLLATGYLKLVDLTGKPLQYTSVLVATTNQSSLLGGAFVVAGGKVDKQTDKQGYVEFSLPRGLEVTVLISGTNIARKLVVPTDPEISAFNLLDPELGSDDLFAVQRSNEEYAVRRSL